MQTKSLPGYTADFSLSLAGQHRTDGRYTQPEQDDVVTPAFRVTCPAGSGGAAMGATCTILGGAAAFPCWWNSGCMWFHAGLVNPVCFSCSFS
jgi:hypothetical protein